MSATVKAVRGTRDLLPPETALWNHVETVARSVFARYGFGEIRTPIFEATELFARGVGEETDIVSKEMYSWLDGERFNEPALLQAWINKHSFEYTVLQSDFSVGGFKVDRIMQKNNEAVIEFVDFRSKFDSAVAAKLKAAMDAYGASGATTSEIKGRLVHVGARAGVEFVAGFLGTIESESLKDDESSTGSFFSSTQYLTLRPENTAGVVRAYIEHKLGDTGQLQKLFYIGPQFRRERPQRGRYRQFWQIGCEVLGPVSSGAESAIRDAEVLEMLASLLDELGVKGWQLALNSVGSSTDRPRYVAALLEALAPVKHLMCEDNQRRAETNPLRVLDSKDPNDQAIIDGLPKIADFLDTESTEHFKQVLAALDACNVPYTVNPRLVRGLDYYTRTTFEFTVPDGQGLGTQNALLGGGRYDGLSEMLGGPKAPGIGFAIGEDRLILTLQAQATETLEPKKLDAYIAPIGSAQNAAALALARELRRAGLCVEVGDGSFRLKRSFEAAEKAARHIVILGEDEVTSGLMKVKTFATGEQTSIARSSLLQLLR